MKGPILVVVFLLLFGQLVAEKGLLERKDVLIDWDKEELENGKQYSHGPGLYDSENVGGAILPTEHSRYKTKHSAVKQLSAAQKIARFRIALSKRCGKIKYHLNDGLSDYIFGGRDAKLGHIPWIAILGYKDKKPVVEWGTVECGGSLISHFFVVTAAHCVDTMTPVAVRLGAYNLNKYREEQTWVQEIKVVKVEYHSQWSPNGKLENDIALLKLERRVKYTDYVQPICLPPPEYEEQDFANQEAMVAGWGLTAQGSTPKSSPILQELALRVWDINECLSSSSQFTKNQICAGGIDDKDSCNGDSGGPLIWRDSSDPEHEIHYLIGLVSFGSKNCGIGEPGIYTRITSYMDWILEKMYTM